MSIFNAKKSEGRSSLSDHYQNPFLSCVIVSGTPMVSTLKKKIRLLKLNSSV